MNKVFVILLISILFFACSNNEDKKTESGFDTFKKAHINDKDIVTLSIPTFMAKMFIKSESKETQEAISKINGLDFILKEKADDIFKSEIEKHISNKKYKTFLTLTEENSDIKVLTNQKDSIINELIVLINSKKDNTYVMLRVNGEFDSKNLYKVTKSIDIEAISKYK